MAAKCKTLIRDIEHLAYELHVDIPKELLEYMAEKTEEKLLEIIKDSESVASDKKRKTVNIDDVRAAIRHRHYPFET